MKTKGKGKKFKENVIFLFILVILTLAALAVASFIVSNLDKFTISHSTNATVIEIPMPGSVTELYTYSNKLTLSPTSLCVGDTTRADVDTNIPNGQCVSFYNAGSGFKFLQTFRLSVLGDYSGSYEINQPGTATIIAVCCDNDGNCRTSNSVYITVTSCAATTTTTTINTPTTYTCYDSDGLNFNVLGHCEDSYTMT
jgi:hypothetical protein